MLSTSSPPPAPARSHKPGSPTRAIVFLAVASFASQAMIRAADTLLPQVAADFAISIGAASIVITAYAVAHGSMQFVIGPIADRIGKFRAVAIACALSAATAVLCGLAQSLDALTLARFASGMTVAWILPVALARFASGMTVAWILPVALAFVGDVVPYEQRQQVLGRFLGGQVMGQMFGQAAGGVIGDYFGWRNVFFVLAAMFAIAAAALAYELFTNAVTRAGRDTPRGRGMRADYAAILSNPWARVVLLVTFIEAALFQGVFPFVGADLHMRFGLSFSAIGLVIGAFAFGGLVYALTVKPLMERIGQIGIARTGGFVMSLAFVTLAFEPVWYFAPLATLGTGLGFYMLHNTLQTESTQMVPEARGTSVALFASVYFLGQTGGVALGAPVVDRYGAPVLFVVSAVLLPLLGWWFTQRLKQR